MDLKYKIACVGFSIAKQLEADDEAWKMFRCDPFWGDHSTLDRQKCLAYALMYTYGGHRGRIAEVARDHARAFNDLWISQASPKEAFKKLREVSFSGLKKRHSAVAKKRLDKRALASRAFVVEPSAEEKLSRLRSGSVANAIIEVHSTRSGRLQYVVRTVQPRGPSGPDSPRLMARVG